MATLLGDDASSRIRRRSVSTVMTLRLRGGAKHKSARPRSWKEQSTHHAEMRKASIRKNRGKNAQAATYTKEARENIRKIQDARRLREMQENEERKKRLKEDRATDFNHKLRLEYMRANEEADRRRAEKYQTLDDYSDSVERELEELRQKRGETRGLTIPDWRGEGHHNFWREVDAEIATEDMQALSDPEQVLPKPAFQPRVFPQSASMPAHTSQPHRTNDTVQSAVLHAFLPACPSSPLPSPATVLPTLVPQTFRAPLSFTLPLGPAEKAEAEEHPPSLRRKAPPRLKE